MPWHSSKRSDPVMGLLRWFKRKKQSRGHGVHSPFAFELITKVLRSPHAYYAFSDIPAMLRERGLDPELVTPFNHLSFRLLRHFNPRRILEINPGKRINTLFLRESAPDARYTCFETDPASLSFARMLHTYREETWQDSRRHDGMRAPRFVSSFPPPREGTFDAIFLYLDNATAPPVEALLELGHEGGFWVIHPIRKGAGKQFWSKIVNEENIKVTFDMKDTGVVFLDPSLTPARYFV